VLALGGDLATGSLLGFATKPPPKSDSHPLDQTVMGGKEHPLLDHLLNVEFRELFQELLLFSQTSFTTGVHA
jgi:hypothetical protein